MTERLFQLLNRHQHVMHNWWNIYHISKTNNNSRHVISLIFEGVFDRYNAYIIRGSIAICDEIEDELH